MLLVNLQHEVRNFTIHFHFVKLCIVNDFSQARHMGRMRGRHLLGIVASVVFEVVFIGIILIILVASSVARFIFVVVRIVVLKISCKLHTRLL
jgi:hypothetical protein